MSGPELRATAAACMCAGLRVFPVRGKQPDIPHGVNAASNDLALIPFWWPDGTARGIALATGGPGGVWVLDVDGPGAIQALLDLQAVQVERIPPTVTSRTARGWHAFFAMPADREVRNSASKVGAGIDVRGTGGYVVLPPSPHPSGARYAWAPSLAPWEIGLGQAPIWLVDLVVPGVRLNFMPPPRPAMPILRGRYVQAAVAAEVAAVASAAEGSRNNALNRAAYAVARFAESGEADAFELARELAWAASYAGLSTAEIRRTIESAFRSRGVLA